MSEEETKVEKEDKKRLHVRYEWFDQFRGLIIIFLIISVITWPLTGDITDGDPAWLGPPLLNHGFQYFKGYPALITIIDIGQQIFMLVLGFGAYLAFSSRREKRGVKAAWKHAGIRIGILFLLAIVVELIGGDLFSANHTWNEALYYGTLANLAIGTFAAYLAVYLVPNSADKRMYLAIGILVIHAALYFLPFIKHYQDTWPGTWPSDPWTFPWNALNHAAIAIAGTCFSQWYKMDPEDPKIGFKKRILPVSTIAIIIFYCYDWIQAAEHHDATTSLALLAIAASGFLIAIFYGFEQLRFKVPILSEMGRNMLLLFILALLIDFYIGFLAESFRDFLVMYPIITMLLVGILPIVFEAGIAMLLARKKWIIKL